MRSLFIPAHVAVELLDARPIRTQTNQLESGPRLVPTRQIALSFRHFSYPEKTMTDQKPLLEEFALETLQLQNAPTVDVELHPLAAIAIISQIQLASRHPDNNGWNRDQAVLTAKTLQQIFPPESAIAKVLELGWNPIFDQSANPTADLEQFFQEIKQAIFSDLNDLETDPDVEWILDFDGQDSCSEASDFDEEES